METPSSHSRANVGGIDRTSRGRGPRRRFGLYAAYCVIVSLICLEVLTRHLDTEPIPFVVPSQNPKLVYELNPEYEGINSWGLRGPEIDRAALADRPVVAMIGDSHTFSAEVQRVKQSIPARLEWHLEHGSPRVDAAVLNFGIPGYNTAQELALFESRVMALEPELVILQYTINDLNVCNYIQPRLLWLNTLIHRSAFGVWGWKQILYSEWGRAHLYEWVGLHLPDLLLHQPGLVGTLRADPQESPELVGHPPQSPDRVPAPYHYMLGRENWIAHIDAFGDLARSAGIRLIATGLIEAADRGVFERAGFEVLSFYDIFEGRDMHLEGGYDPADSSDHFDVRGSEIIAVALAEASRRRWRGDRSSR